MIKLDYVWLDGYETPNLRSKTKYVDIDNEQVSIDTIPDWGFDGSSTMQADGEDSDCLLKPIKIYKNTTDKTYSNASYIVLCEVLYPDGTAHETNTRSRLSALEDETHAHEMWFGIEQEYVFMEPEKEIPFGWPEKGFPNPQGRYYCGVGGDVVRLRNIVEEHANCCVEAGIPISGTNAEVMLSQWEYQIGTTGTVDVCDDLWVARYMLELIGEREGACVSLSPKPIKGDWNGSGAHINFSNKRMRETPSLTYMDNIINHFENLKDEHIKEYGIGNENRLTGEHETQHIDSFSSGVSDRGASIRIPMSTATEGMGYLEDRRPAANMDPYRAVARIIETIKGVEEEAKELPIGTVYQTHVAERYPE